MSSGCAISSANTRLNRTRKGGRHSWKVWIFLSPLQSFVSTHTGTLGSVQQEEDIGWEDDDEEPNSPAATTGPSRTRSQREADKPESTTAPSTEQHLMAPAAASTPGTLSPRESSEESYDMLSSSRTSNVGEAPSKAPEKVKKAEDEEEDSGSDWE